MMCSSRGGGFKPDRAWILLPAGQPLDLLTPARLQDSDRSGPAYAVSKSYRAPALCRRAGFAGAPRSSGDDSRIDVGRLKIREARNNTGSIPIP
jgi:hypothetical protein